MVGCWRCTYPSIHFFVSRSRPSVDCARVQAFTFLLTKTLSRSRSGCLVRGGVCVWCWWCVSCVCTCGVVCGVGGVGCVCTCGGACVCGEAWLSYLYFSLFFFFFFFSFSCSFSYSCSLALVLSLFLLSSLLATKHYGKNRSTNTAANIEAVECDLAQGKCTSSRFSPTRIFPARNLFLLQF